MGLVFPVRLVSLPMSQTVRSQNPSPEKRSMQTSSPGSWTGSATPERWQAEGL